MFDEKEMIIITIKYVVTIGFLTICSFTTDDKDLRSRSGHKI